MMRHAKAILPFLCGGALFGSGCAPGVRPEASRPDRRPSEVRVGLVEGATTVILRSRGAWEGRDAAGRWPIADGTVLESSVRDGWVRVSAGGGAPREVQGTVQLTPERDECELVLNEVPYRGRLQLRAAGGGLTVVVVLDLEEYLRGVVPWEIGRLGPEALAAVEAQAIAARTYTVKRLGAFDDRGFDVYADERDQVFKGSARYDPTCDAAITSTRRQVVVYGGEPVHAYYSSTCGGHTSWIENVWPKPARPYLRGRRDAPAGERSFCAGSRHFRWTEAWSGAEMERTLQQTLPRALRLPAGRAIGGLLDLRVSGRDASGRILDLEVRTTMGTYDVRGDTIRWVLKPRDRALLRSLMFDLTVERDAGAIVRVVARGGGNGHGVGLCQMGAIGMARAGYDCAAILRHYYPGTQLVTIDR